MIRLKAATDKRTIHAIIHAFFLLLLPLLQQETKKVVVVRFCTAVDTLLHFRLLTKLKV